MNSDSINIPFPNAGATPPDGDCPDSHVEPAEGATPQSAAGELLAHGLLTYLHNDRPEVQSERVDRLMGTITREVADASGRPTHRLRFPIRTVKGWMALAAGIALLATATFLGLPTEASAQAVVEQSIAAMRKAGAGGDRRYEVLFTVRGENEDVQLKPATVDMRGVGGAAQLLLLATAPDGHEVIAGRDEKGDWCYRREQDGGGVEREQPELAWPRWSRVGDESLFADSVDRLLEELTKRYTLTRDSDVTLAGHAGSFHHITATRKQRGGPGGNSVEIWIDPLTNAVERIEMKWNEPPGGSAPGDGAPGDARERGPNDRPPGPPNRRGPRGGGPGMDADGPGPDDADGDRRPPPRRPRPEGAMGGPDHDPMDGPPNDDRPRHPRRDGRMGPPGGPDGRPGPGGLGPAGPRGPGDRRLPPKLLIIQRVEAPQFADNWFSPEGHASK